jgi:replicative DNA helicase
MGKTALALNIAENIAIKEKIPVGIFSIEMSKEQLALRMLCGKSGINQHLLRTGRLKDSEWQKLTLGADTLANAEIHIDDSGALTALEMRAKARRLKSQHNVGLIIVDYIQMMTGAARIENRQQEMSMISRAFKSLAKELNIPVIAVSQLSRAVEQRGQDKMPQLSDLRESGALEQDADLVMFVYREAYYMKPEDARYPEVENLAVIKVAKQRNGPTGNVKMAFIRDYIRFENLAAQYGQEVPIPDEGTPF